MEIQQYTGFSGFMLTLTLKSITPAKEREMIEKIIRSYHGSLERCDQVPEQRVQQTLGGQRYQEMTCYTYVFDINEKNYNELQQDLRLIDLLSVYEKE